MNWHQIWEVASAPDNVPIVALLFLIPFYTWYAFHQALENDALIDKLSADPALAKTEYRKTEPWNPKWEKEVHTWPYLMRIELVAADRPGFWEERGYHDRGDPWNEERYG